VSIPDQNFLAENLKKKELSNKRECANLALDANEIHCLEFLMQNNIFLQTIVSEKKYKNYLTMTS